MGYVGWCVTSLRQEERLAVRAACLPLTYLDDDMIMASLQLTVLVAAAAHTPLVPCHTYGLFVSVSVSLQAYVPPPTTT